MAPEPAQQAGRSWRPGLIILIVVLVAAAVGAAYWFLNRPSGPYRYDNSGLYPIEENGKKGYIDRQGKIVIPPQFDDAQLFNEGYAIVKSGNKAGYINTKGEVVIPFQFDDALWFKYGRAPVKLCCGHFYQQNADDRYGFIDTSGKYVGTPEFLWVGFFSGDSSRDLAPVKTSEGKYGFVDRSGKLVIPGLYEKADEFGSGLAPAELRGKWGFIDESGKWVINPQFDSATHFTEGLAAVTLAKKTGFIDSTGAFVINPQFDGAFFFAEGLAPIKVGQKWGYADKKGQIVINPTYDFAAIFREGLAVVRQGPANGFIDTSGKWVIPPRFTNAMYMSGGMAGVKMGADSGYVDKSGKIIWPAVDPALQGDLIYVPSNQGAGLIELDPSQPLNRRLAPCTNTNASLVAWNPSRREYYVATINGDHVSIFSADPFTESDKFSDSIGWNSYDLQVSHNGNYMFLTGVGGKLLLFDTRTHALLRRAVLPTGEGMSYAAFSPDDRTIYVSAGDSIFVYSTDTLEVRGQYRGDGWKASAIITSADGSYLFFVQNQALIKWSTQTNDLSGATLLPEGVLSRPQLSQNSILIAGQRAIYRVRSSTADLTTIPVEGRAAMGGGFPFAESSNGRYLYVATGNDANADILILDASNGSLVKTIHGVPFPSMLLVRRAS